MPWQTKLHLAPSLGRNQTPETTLLETMGQKLKREATPTKVHTLTPADKTPQTIPHGLPGGSEATPMGALARTRHQDKNPLDDSTRIAQGLRGSYRVHKPRVPNGPTFQQKLGPTNNVANDMQLLGCPGYLTIG